MRLAFDVGLAGFALGIEGVEGEVEIMLGRLARVDRAALLFWRRRLHGAAPDDVVREPSPRDDRRPGFSLLASGA